MTRTQFPLRLAYSLTINKSQGQQFQKIMVDIRKPAFSHGHLYVAMSRIRNNANIKFFVDETNIYDEEVSFTYNVVYNEIIEAFTI
jgi:ATP-dependent exoDNAse (exonuclease V) alpha subunit